MKLQPRWLFSLSKITLIIISVFFSMAAIAEDPVTGAEVDEFDTKDDDNSALFNWLPGETYDPRTSTIGYYVSDLRASGTGLDIVINREFDMSIEPFTQRSVYPKSFGSMMLDTPRLEYTTYKINDAALKCNGLVISDQMQNVSGATTISGAGLKFHANNNTVTFFPKSLGSYSSSRFPGNAVYVSADNWYIDCEGETFRVHQPNGNVYSLNVHQHHSTRYLALLSGAKPKGLREATKKTVYVSKIVDPSNNSLNYSYDDQTRRWIGKTFTQKVLSTITANDGRRVTITLRELPDDRSAAQKKECPPLIKKISYNKDPSKNIEYEYDVDGSTNPTNCDLQVNRVVRNDGSKFIYDYNLHISDENYPLTGGLLWAESNSDDEDDTDTDTDTDSDSDDTRAIHAIKSITYPEGAKVSYTYIPLEQCAFTAKITVVHSDAKNTCGKIAALSTRAITGDLIPSGMTWEFGTQQIPEVTTAPTAPKMFRSVINGPAVNGRRARQVFKYVVKYANSEAKDVGAPNGKLIQHQVIDVPADYSNTGVLIKETNYTWDFHGDVVDFSKLKPWNKSQKFAWQHLYNSRARKIIAKTIAVDGNIFKTEFGNFDIYGNAMRHAQYHGSLGRTVALEFLNRKNPWIIAKVSKKTVEKIDGSIDFMLLERTFNSTGQVSGERVNGLYNAYSYHPDGELHTVKNGDNTQMSTFTNYTLGVPKTLSRASSTGTVQKAVTLFESGKVKTESAWGKPSVKTGYKYNATGQLQSVEPHITQDTTIWNANWSLAGDPSYRRKYTRIGDMYRHITHHDTLGRPLIQYEQDPEHGDIAFTYFRYDANGRLAYQSLPVRDNYVSKKDTIYDTPLLAGYKFEYDALGRVTRKIHTIDGSQTRHCYSNRSCKSSDMLGNSHVQKLSYGKATKDAEGYFTIVNYRALGNPSSQHVVEIQQQVAGQSYVTTSISRDLINRISSVTQDGITRHYTYKSGTDLLASETHPETGKTQFTSYDSRGNLTQSISADGSVTNFTYYQNNLIKAIDYPSGTVDSAFIYNSDNSLKSLTSGSATRSFSYREDGLLVSETTIVDNETMTVAYKYDDYGFVNKTTYPSGQGVQQSNNTLGWVKAIPSVVSDISYHSNGVMSEAILNNGKKFFSQLDGNKRVKRWQTLDQDGNNNVLKLVYLYDVRGNVGTLRDKLFPAQDISMAYDGLSRLTKADSSGLWGAGLIAYNNSGDITQLQLGTEQLNYHYAHTYPSGQKKLLRHVSSTSGLNNYLFEYDRNGNVIDNGKRSFVYDKASRMIHADVGGRVYDFLYDGDGRRVRSIRQDTDNNNTPITSTKVTRYFFYNSEGKLMYEKNKNTGIRKDYIYANGKVIAERHYYNTTVDTDHDGIPNYYEELYGLQVDNEADAYVDSDNDGVSNYQEFKHGSNPNSQDTDNDGLNDWMEADYGLNIVEDDGFEDLDGDGVSNYNEVIV